MHEYGIAQRVLEAVLEEGKKQKARRVSEIKVEVGLLNMVTPQSLEEAFSVVSENTIAQGAKLTVKEVPGYEISLLQMEVETE